MTATSAFQIGSSHAVYRATNLADLQRPKSPSVLESRRQRFSVQLFDLLSEAVDVGIDPSDIPMVAAFDFIECLDVRVAMPAISLEPDGTLLMEWVKRERDESLTMFAVILDGKNYIFSSMKNGVTTSNGVLNYCDDSRNMIQYRIAENFAPNAAARVAVYRSCQSLSV